MISGRILNQAKEPVPGIEVTARSYPYPVNAGGDIGSGVSAADGQYEITGVADGEYQVRTTATDRYRAAQTIARAGFSSADITLEGDYEIRVVGTVTDTDGQPLAAVRVVPADLQRQTQTDSTGSYEAFMIVKWAEGTYAFQFLAKGYRDKLVYVKGADIAGLQETRVDAQLEPLGDTTVVTGVVKAEDGTPVPGASIQLQSALLNTTYRSMSGPGGSFSISDVKIGTNYRLVVVVGKEYRDYVQDFVEVANGVFLDVAMASLDIGRLTGHMVDVEGAPIPRFSLWLSSSDARAQAVQISGDDSGAFSVDQAPAGPLSFSTRSVPQINVSGFTMPPGESQDVQLVLDWGEGVIEGHVTDSRGNPVPGAQLSLAWSNQSGGARSTSTRTTLTDADGSFRFTQLGPGSHQLVVTAPGHGSGQHRVDVAAGRRDVEVSLP